MKQRVYRTLSHLGVPRVLDRVNADRLTIVMYHGFTDRERGRDIVNFEGLHLHVDAFRRHLELLRDRYHVISLDEALGRMEQGRPLPPNAVVLTMDDGYRSNHALAFPLLREFSMPATIFLATDFVDLRRFLWTDRVEYAIDRADAALLAARDPETFASADTVAARGRHLRRTKSTIKRVDQSEREALVEALERELGHALASAADVPPEYLALDWSEIDEMARSGLVDFGSHSASHFILARCSDERIVMEVQQARGVIEERTGRPCPLFCYPNGKRTDFDARTRRAVQEAGHRCALTTVVGTNPLDADRYELKRVSVMNGDTLEDFEMSLCGIARWAAGTRDRLLGNARAN